MDIMPLGVPPSLLLSLDRIKISAATTVMSLKGTPFNNRGYMKRSGMHLRTPKTDQTYRP